MKLSGILNEGTWAAPQTVEQARELAELMKTPLLAYEAADKLYHLIGDDELFDSIAEVEDKDPDGDVRSLVADTLKKWIKEGEKVGFHAWKDPWDPEALSILAQIVRQFDV